MATEKALKKKHPDWSEERIKAVSKLSQNAKKGKNTSSKSSSGSPTALLPPRGELGRLEDKYAESAPSHYLDTLRAYCKNRRT